MSDFIKGILRRDRRRTVEFCKEFVAAETRCGPREP